MSTVEANRGWTARVAAMAAVCGIGVAVVYLPQPVQTLVAQEFHVPIESSAAPSTAVLAGYALGILLLAPLGDRVSAHRQAPVHILLTAAGIAAAATATTFDVFVLLSFLIGIATTVGQVVISAALREAPPGSRAATAAVLSGSFVVGLFTTRAAVGALSDLFGWRAVFLGFALVVLCCFPLALWAVPRRVASPGIPYLTLLRSMPGMVRDSAALRIMTLTHNFAFTSFIAVWSTVTVLAVGELGMSVSEAALLALAGLAAAVTTILLAPLHPRLGVSRALVLALLVLLAGALTVLIGWHSIPVLAVGLYLVTLGMSSSQVSTQARAMSASGARAAGRANTIFMTTTFLFGAAVTAGSAVLASRFGYSAIGALATLLAALAIGCWFIARRVGLD